MKKNQINFTEEDCLALESINDFIRLGCSWARQQTLHFGHGTDNAMDDIYQLIVGSLNLPYHLPPELLEARLTPKEKKFLFYQLKKRIIDYIPVPYLTNQAYFCDLEFYVDGRVLIPRSPLAELIKNQFAPWAEEDRAHRVLDLCTGSACVAIACCYAFPDAQVDASDVSEDALEVARINQSNHALEEQLRLFTSDVFDSIPQKPYDIIISNPPYVGSEEMDTLPEEYSHEPHMALQAENNGLAIVDNILQNAINYLSPHGILVVEVGNTEAALSREYPDLPFMWLDFEHGGHGVFLLTREQLSLFNR